VGFEVGEEGSEFLGAMGELRDADARIVEIEQSVSGLLEHTLRKGRGTRSKVDHARG